MWAPRFCLSLLPTLFIATQKYGPQKKFSSLMCSLLSKKTNQSDESRPELSKILFDPSRKKTRDKQVADYLKITSKRRKKRVWEIGWIWLRCTCTYDLHVPSASKFYEIPPSFSLPFILEFQSPVLKSLMKFERLNGASDSWIFINEHRIRKSLSPWGWGWRKRRD